MDDAPDDVASELPSQPSWGLSLSALREVAGRASEVFSASASAPTPLSGMTADVVQHLICPLTASDRCSYAELLLLRAAPGTTRGHPGADVGEATVFVSHAWGCPFLDLVDAVCMHVEGQPHPDRAFVFIGASCRSRFAR